MIKEATIISLVERLEYFTKLSRSGMRCLDKRLLADTESMTYDVRNDIIKNQYDFDGLVPEEELNESKKEIERLEDEVSYLNDRLSESEG